MKSLSILGLLLLPSHVLAGVVPGALPGSEMEGPHPNNLVRRDCHANNCARAVTGTNAKPALTARQSDCSSFMLTTVILPTNTITQTVVATVTEGANLQRRDETISPSNVPTYASACTNSAQYSSACSCWGITAAVVTSPGPTVTATVTSTTTVPAPVQTHTGYLQVKNVANGAVLGYVGSQYTPPAYMYIQPISTALVVTVTAPVGSTFVTQAELTMINSNHPFPFFGFVQGRDSTDSFEQPGSFNYLYQSGTAHSAPGAIPAAVGSTYNQNTGLARTSESSVWNINFINGAVTGTWINPDGNAAQSLQLFTQSNGLYAGSDPHAFMNRYPAPVTVIGFTFIPV